MTKPLLSRTGARGSPIGKLTVAIPSFKVSEETYEMLRQAANAAELGVGEFVRKLIEIRFHGQAHLAKIEAERIAVVAGVDDK